MRWSQTSTRLTAAGLSYTVDLPSILNSPNAYVGFTSGTGSGYGEYNILSWSFVNEYKEGGITPGVPEPETYALLLAGVAVLATRVARARRSA